MQKILTQLKQRRKELKLTQKDMHSRIGISRQQYQALESKGNPRLDTLELVAVGLNSELMLIPKEKLRLVKEILNADAIKYAEAIERHHAINEEYLPIKDPWKGLLSDLDDEF